MRMKPALNVIRALALALPLASVACSGSGENASGDAAADSVAQTPQTLIAQSEKLRAEGKFKEAKDAAIQAFTLAREGPRVAERIELAKVFGAAGESASAINEIKSLETEKRESGVPVDEVDIAEVYAQIGDPNAVFRWLDRAIAQGSPNLAGIENNTDLSPVKTDARWADFVARVPK